MAANFAMEPKVGSNGLAKRSLTSGQVEIIDLTQSPQGPTAKTQQAFPQESDTDHSRIRKCTSPHTRNPAKRRSILASSDFDSEDGSVVHPHMYTRDDLAVGYDLDVAHQSRVEARDSQRNQISGNNRRRRTLTATWLENGNYRSSYTPVQGRPSSHGFAMAHGLPAPRSFSFAPVMPQLRHPISSRMVSMPQCLSYPVGIPQSTGYGPWVGPYARLPQYPRPVQWSGYAAKQPEPWILRAEDVNRRHGPSQGHPLVSPQARQPPNSLPLRNNEPLPPTPSKQRKNRPPPIKPSSRTMSLPLVHKQSQNAMGLSFIEAVGAKDDPSVVEPVGERNIKKVQSDSNLRKLTDKDGHGLDPRSHRLEFPSSALSRRLIHGPSTAPLSTEGRFPPFNPLHKVLSQPTLRDTSNVPPPLHRGSFQPLAQEVSKGAPPLAPQLESVAATRTGAPKSDPPPRVALKRSPPKLIVKLKAEVPESLLTTRQDSVPTPTTAAIPGKVVPSNTVVRTGLQAQALKPVQLAQPPTPISANHNPNLSAPPTSLLPPTGDFLPTPVSGPIDTLAPLVTPPQQQAPVFPHDFLTDAASAERRLKSSHQLAEWLYILRHGNHAVTDNRCVGVEKAESCPCNSCRNMLLAVKPTIELLLDPPAQLFDPAAPPITSPNGEVRVHDSYLNIRRVQSFFITMFVGRQVDGVKTLVLDPECALLRVHDDVKKRLGIKKAYVDWLSTGEKWEGKAWAPGKKYLEGCRKERNEYFEAAGVLVGMGGAK